MKIMAAYKLKMKKMAAAKNGVAKDMTKIGRLRRDHAAQRLCGGAGALAAGGSGGYPAKVVKAEMAIES